MSQEIIFIRHGPPEFDSSRWLHKVDMQSLLHEYTHAHMLATVPEPLSQLADSYSDEAVFCSTLIRSVDSANVLGFPNATQMQELDEAQLPCPPWSGYPVSFTVASVVLRMAWLLGYSKQAESCRYAKVRAQKATSLLIEQSMTHGRLLVVGHGIMNRMVCRELAKQGWFKTSRVGRGYWESTQMQCFP